MKPAQRCAGLLVGLIVLAGGPAWGQGQRIQFPTPDPSVAPLNSAGPGTVAYQGPAAGTTYPPQTYSQPGAFTPDQAGGYGTSPLPGAASQTPAYTSPPPTDYPYTGPAPSASIDPGSGALPPPSWDPYTSPSAQPPCLLPQDPYAQVPPATTFGQMTRFLQQVSLESVWMYDRGNADGFTDTSAEATATFAVPFLTDIENPLLITPGFAFHFWNGPDTPLIDLPPRVYDAYLDTTWYPQVSPWLGGEINFRVGIYSDLKKVNADTLRYTGRGLAVVNFSPSFQLKFGVWYLDRVRIKLLPAGGIVWMPSSDIRFDILFPNPGMAFRLGTTGNTEWWLYARGEYGGGSWTMEDPIAALPAYNVEQVDYNDIRVGVGLEFRRFTGPTGLVEVGWATRRELRFRFDGSRAELDDTFYVRGGLAF